MADALETVRAFHVAFEARDEEQFAALVADDIVILNPLGNVVATGREAAVEWLRRNAEDDVHVTPAGGAKLAPDGETVTWPQTMLMEKTGARIAATGVFHVRAGKIARFEPTIDSR